MACRNWFPTNGSLRSFSRWAAWPQLIPVASKTTPAMAMVNNITKQVKPDRFPLWGHNIHNFGFYLPVISVMAQVPDLLIWHERRSNVAIPNHHFAWRKNSVSRILMTEKYSRPSSRQKWKRPAQSRNSTTSTIDTMRPHKWALILLLIPQQPAWDRSDQSQLWSSQVWWQVTITFCKATVNCDSRKRTPKFDLGALDICMY